MSEKKTIKSLAWVGALSWDHQHLVQGDDMAVVEDWVILHNSLYITTKFNSVQFKLKFIYVIPIPNEGHQKEQSKKVDCNSMKAIQQNLILFSFARTM